MRFERLAQASEQVRQTSARLKKVSQLAACLEGLPPEELRIAVTLLTGELPQGKIGVGHATLSTIRAPASTAPTLTLAEVMGVLDAVATTSGKGSKERKLKHLGTLLGSATAPEQDFLRRLLVGELRQGALEGVLTEAVARVTGVSAHHVRRALMLRGVLAEVAAVARAEGEAGLTRFRIELMTPLSPMLAQTAESPSEALAKLGQASLEYKLDGARVQVHRDGDDVRVFTRKLHEVTARVPELVEAVAALPAHSLVLDGEALALGANGRPQPFQVTMRRFGRRTDVANMREKLPLSGVYFDCLHVNGQDLIDRPARERRAALEAAFGRPADGVASETTRLSAVAARAVPGTLARDPAEAEAFLQRALSEGHEGIMAKDPRAGYEAGRRGASWLKVKPVRTLDLVVLAVEWGSGRRAGKLSNIHLGAREPETGGFVMVGKTFKGMTDAMLAWQTERFLQLELDREGHVVHVRPEQVVEVAFDGVQQSPQYPGGVALRFARVKCYRQDKSATQADTISEIRALLP